MYNSARDVELTPGKLKSLLGKASTVQEFIEQVGTRSMTSGKTDLVRTSEGRRQRSAVFLQQEHQRIEGRR